MNSIARFFRTRRWAKPVAIIAGIVLVLVIAGIIIFNNTFGELKQVKLDENDLGISEEATKNITEEKINDIMNIALFGIDTTDGAATIGDQYRSDCIIVFTIDPIHNVFKMTSILRDSRVPIEGHDPQKINAAYKYGGAQLAVKTINQNFKTNIRDYVTVDFAEMAEIINIVGGLTIDITAQEAQNMMQNNIIEPVEEGRHLLDGYQAVAYARVRKIDSDFNRASRQQKVLELLFDKIKNMPASDYPDLIKSFLKCVETSLSYGDILTIARSMDLKTAKIVKNTIPDAKYEEGLWGGIDNTGSWVWVYDLNAAAARLKSIIYDVEMEEVETTTYDGGGDIKPATNPVQNNSNDLNDYYYYYYYLQQQREKETKEEDDTEATSVSDDTTQDQGGGDVTEVDTGEYDPIDPTQPTNIEPTTEETTGGGEEPIEPSSEEEPTEVTTEAPTESTTEAPTEATTEAPTEATTEAPTEATTEAPTEASTEAPTEATTGAPVENVQDIIN